MQYIILLITLSYYYIIIYMSMVAIAKIFPATNYCVQGHIHKSDQHNLDCHTSDIMN